MKIIINQHIKDGEIQDQWAHVIGSNNRPHRINSYSKITYSSIKRIVENSASVKQRVYSGEEGHGYILETEYKM